MKRRIQKLLILLIAAALMACCTPGCGTVTPTPTPTGTPDSTPTPATTPSPTPDDTVVPPATDAPVTTPEPTPSQSPALTETERMAEIEAFLSQEPQNLFLQAVYDDVSQLPLHIALRQYSDRFIPYEEAENILLDAGYEVVADISYFNSEGLDNILRRMTGYGLADKDWNNTLVYVAEADMYSSQHSDTWLQRVICTDVEVSGDLYTVTYKGNLKFYYFDENTKLHKAYQMVVTLRKSENGEYHFVSNHPVLTDDAKLAEIEAFLNTAPQNNFIQNIYSDISELPFSTMTYNYHCDDDSAAYGRSVFGIPEDTAVCCFDYRDLDDLLRRFTGYGKSEHNWTDDLNTYYSPGFNIYCRELAAPIDQTVSCISITTDGDICTVTYTTQSGEPFRYRSRGGQPFSSGQMAVTLRDLGNGEYHFISNLALTEPQLTESEHLAEIEHFLNQQPQNLFIRAVYDDISQLPLDVALREYCDFCIPYEDAQQVLLDAGYELYTDISYFNSEGLDSILRRMTGYGLDDIQWKNSTVYVEDADLYLKQHGDTNYHPVECTSIEIDGDLYKVTYRGASHGTWSYYNEFVDFSYGNEMVVTLRGGKNGEYYFVANHAIYPQPTTEEDLLNELTDFFSRNTSPGFLKYAYDDVRCIPLSIAADGYRDRSLPSAKILRSAEAAGIDSPKTSPSFKSASLDTYLRSYTGYGLDDADWINDLLYLPDIDIYISDKAWQTSYKAPLFLSVSLSDTICTVIYTGTDYTQNVPIDYYNSDGELLSAERMVLKLRSLGNGEYQFISNLPLE